MRSKLFRFFLAFGLMLFGALAAPAAEPLRLEVPINELELGGAGSIGGVYVYIKGGVAPFTLTASNDNVAIRRGKLSTTYSITPQKLGTSELIVKDSTGATASQIIKVVPKNADFKATLSSPTLNVGAVVTLTITGGTPPYKVDFIQPVRYKVERLAEGSYRLTGITAGGGEIQITDSKGRSTSAGLRPAPFVMTIAKNALTVGEETVLELKGGTSPYQFDVKQAQMLGFSMIAENKYRALTYSPGTPTLTARDALSQTVYVPLKIIAKPIPIEQQPLTLKIEPLKIHSHPNAVPPVSTTLTITGGKPPYQVNGGGLLTVESIAPDRFKITGKGQKGANIRIDATDSEGRKGQTLMHLIPQFSGDFRTGPIKVGSTVVFKITGGEPSFRITGIDPKIVRVTQTRMGGLSGPRPGDPLETVTVTGLAPGSLTLIISDLNNMYSIRCPITVVP